MNIGSVTFLLGANTAGLTRAAGNMRRFESQVIGSNTRMQSSFAALGSQMMLVGTMMTQYLTVPIGLLATVGVVTFAKYETQMAKIVALTGTTQAQANSWSHDILSMSKEFGQAPKDVAAAMYFIASPALKASTAMDVLKASSMGAAIGLGETTVIGKALVNVINAYGESNITASHALDVMLTATKNGVMEASDLASALGKILPTAQALGVGFEDLTGSIAALTLTGKTANEASTQLNRLFSTLIQARPRAEKVLKSFGISFEDLRTTLRDKGMMATIQQLSTMIGGSTLDEIQNTKAFEDNIDVLGDVFTNLRALLPVLDMLGPNMKNWENILNNVTKSSGSAATAWNVISGTVAERFKIAVASMKVSLVGFGETIKEPLVGLIQSLARWVENLSNWFQSLSSSTQSNIISWAGWLAVLGPVLLIGGSLIGVFRSLGTVIVAIIPIIQAAWLACLANPLGALATGIALVIALGNVWYQSSLKGSVVQQALNDVNAIALQNIVSQKQELESLVRLATNQNAALKMREEAVQRINTISPEYLGTITQETLRTGEASVAIREYIRMLGLKAKAEAVKANMVELERKRLSDVASGSDKQVSWLDKTAIYTNTLMSSFTGQFNKNTFERFWDEQETANAAGSRKVYKQLMDFYIKLDSDLQLQIEGVKVTSVPVMLQGVAKATADAAAAKAELEEAAKEAAKFWKAYAGKDVAGKMSNLTTLMETASGKQLDYYAKLWVALDKTKFKQDAMIESAKAVAANQPFALNGVDYTTSMVSDFKKMAGTLNLDKLKNIGDAPGANTETDSATRKGGMADIIKYTQDYTRGLQDVIDKKAMLGKSYNLELEQNKVEITYYEEKLKYMRDNGLAVGDTISQLGLLYNAQKKLESSIPVLEAWRNLFRDVASLIGTIGKYMGEEFQKVFGVIQDIVSGVGEFIRIFKDIVKLTELIGTASKDKETVSTAVNTGVLAANTVAQGANVAGTTAMIIANQALSASASELAITEAVAAAAWIPFPGNIAAMATSVAAAIAALATAIPVAAASAIGLATGGTVPSGFPNDSFPAMLTSGETVIPLTKMAEIFGKGAKTGQQQVVFKIHRKELVGILQDAAVTGRSF